MKKIESIDGIVLLLAFCCLLSLICKIYTSQFTSYHGFNDFTRFVDYHISDMFSVLVFSFMLLKIVVLRKGKVIPNVGYIIGFMTLIAAFITEHMPSWKCGLLTKIGDPMDIKMYVLGFIIFCICNYFIERKAKKLFSSPELSDGAFFIYRKF